MRSYRTILAAICLSALCLSCRKVVEKEPIKVTDISVDPVELTMLPGENALLEVSYIPEDATEGKTCQFSSDDTSVATVDADYGIVTAVDAGDTRIWAVSGEIRKSVSVTVVKDNITSITISPESAKIDVGKTCRFSAETVPAKAKGLVWSSDDEEVATVDNTGKVTGVSSGTAIIRVKSYKCEASATVEVKGDEITTLIVSPAKNTLLEGTNVQLSAFIKPSYSTEKISWKSDNINVATVTDAGLVTAIAPGSTTIHATTKKCSADVSVTVQEDRITSISISTESITLMNGATQLVSAEFSPAESTEGFEWISDNPDIATVDRDGNITAHAEGTTTIRAKSSKAEDSMEVTVISSGFVLHKVDPLTKIQNNLKYTDDDGIIRVARGETATVQIEIEAFSSLSDWNAECTYFGNNDSQMLIQPKMYWEREITCTPCWVQWAGGNPTDGSELFTWNDKYYDPLMPVDGAWDPGIVPAGGRAALWCEFSIPRDFNAGTYYGEISISVNTAAGPSSASKTFTVQVYDVTLPEEQGLTVINWETGSFREMNGGVDAYNDIHDVLMPILYRFMNDYGQNAWRLCYGCGSNSSINQYKASIVDGKIKYDFSTYFGNEMKKIIDNCPQIRQIHGQQIAGEFSDGEFSVNCCVIEDGKIVRKDLKISDPRCQEYVSDYMSQLREHLLSLQVGDGRTYYDLYVQTISDEPNNTKAPSYCDVARAIKKGAPDMKITDAISTAEIDPECLDYPCPLLDAIDFNRARNGQTQWMYNSMAPQGNYANRFVRLALIKTRIIHWVNYYYNAVGYLHWGLKYWEGTDDPYGNVQGSIDHTVYLPGGDMYLLYPDYRKVYPSLRVCAMRDGIRDYDLLKMVEAKSPSKADEFLGRIVKGAADYDINVEHFRACRKEMLEYLAK